MAARNWLKSRSAMHSSVNAKPSSISASTRPVFSPCPRRKAARAGVRLLDLAPRGLVQAPVEGREQRVQRVLELAHGRVLAPPARAGTPPRPGCGPASTGWPGPAGGRPTRTERSMRSSARLVLRLRLSPPSRARRARRRSAPISAQQALQEAAEQRAQLGMEADVEDLAGPPRRRAGAGSGSGDAEEGLRLGEAAGEEARRWPGP